MSFDLIPIQMTPEIKRAAETLSTANNVCVLTGAGMSAESGVPTFRGGGGAAVWRAMPIATISSAEMVRTDLPLVWEWFDYRRSVLSGCRPNPGHFALAAAESSGKYDGFKIVTQNIDDLHYAAGSTDVIELHGNIHRSRCVSCNRVSSLIEVDANVRPPKCKLCQSPMRPHVVLFGEMLEAEVVRNAFAAAEGCDVFLVVGTSALVSPANMLPYHAASFGATIIELNPEETQVSEIAEISLRGTSAQVLPQIF